MLNGGDNRPFERITGTAFFQPVGQAGMICVGNIVMHQLNPKVARKGIMRYQGGRSRNPRCVASSATPATPAT